MCMASSQWKRGLAVLASVGTLGVLLAGCGTTPANNTAKNATTPGGTTASKPVEGGSIILDTTSNFKDLDPALSYDTTSMEAGQEMYDQLVTYKGNTTQIQPMLATSYTVSPDGKTYTFTLRQGVKFWNGDPMTAQSFIDEFQRVMDPKVGSPGSGFFTIVQGATAYSKGKAKTISGVTAPDPYTLKIQLTAPEPFFLQVLAMPFFSAVDQKFIDSVGNKAFDSKSAMGTGPYELKSYDANALVLTKNPGYWMKDSFGQQLPYLDKITMRINKNGQLDALNFEQGKTALMANLIGIPSSVYPHFESDPTLKKDIVSASQNAVFYIGLNTQMKPYDNKLVRKAIEFAINKDKIVQLINGRGQVANQPLPPAIDGYQKTLDPNATYTYDPTKAKALLAQAGFPNGFKTTFYSANDPDILKFDASIQNDLAAIGIQAKIDSMDWNSFLTLNEKPNKTGIFYLGWFQDFPDASDFLNTLFNSNEVPLNNSTMYKNSQVDAWLNQAQTDTNTTERMSLYAKVTNKVMDDAVWVPLYYPKAVYAAQPWVHGYYISPVLMDDLSYMWIDPSHSQG